MDYREALAVADREIRLALGQRNVPETEQELREALATLAHLSAILGQTDYNVESVHGL